jgi:hypothetical protein
MTVDQLITRLQAGKVNGTWTGDDTVKICTDFPYHKSIDEISVPESHITDRCVGIYS